MTPGLSVIIEAIKESRRIVQRMNSYAIYRIAETLRVLGFVTLAILLFNFFPVTAIMIVLLALLNDGSILTSPTTTSSTSTSPKLGTCASSSEWHQCSASSAPSPRSACSTLATKSSTSPGQSCKR